MNDIIFNSISPDFWNCRVVEGFQLKADKDNLIIAKTRGGAKDEYRSVFNKSNGQRY